MIQVFILVCFLLIVLVVVIGVYTNDDDDSSSQSSDPQSGENTEPSEFHHPCFERKDNAHLGTKFEPDHPYDPRTVLGYHLWIPQLVTFQNIGDGVDYCKGRKHCAAVSQKKTLDTTGYYFYDRPSPAGGPANPVNAGNAIKDSDFLQFSGSTRWRIVFKSPTQVVVSNLYPLATEGVIDVRPNGCSTDTYVRCLCIEEMLNHEDWGYQPEDPGYAELQKWRHLMTDTHDDVDDVITISTEQFVTYEFAEEVIVNKIRFSVPPESSHPPGKDCFELQYRITNDNTSFNERPAKEMYVRYATVGATAGVDDNPVAGRFYDIDVPALTGTVPHFQNDEYTTWYRTGCFD